MGKPQIYFVDVGRFATKSQIRDAEDPDLQVQYQLIDFFLRVKGGLGSM